MPPNRSKTKQDYIHQEGKIELAIEAIQKKKIPSIAAAARIYGIPRSTLRDRVAGHYPLATTRGHANKMTQLDEDTLTEWILSMEDRGAAPRHAMVRNMANILLAATGSTTVGVNWVGSYIKRTPAIQTRFSRRYNYSRAEQEDPRVLNDWFQLVGETINRPLHFLQKLQTPAERGSAIHMEYTTHMTHFFLISLCPPIIPPTLRIVYILHCE